MKDPIILRRLDTLTPKEAIYWKDLLYRSIKIGTELEVATPKGVPRPTFEAESIEALQPSGSLDRLGVNGVWDVKPEHCGIEIRVIGRHPHFRALHKQYQSILNQLIQNGARARSTCGLHYHVLTPGLAEPVPEIILANLWNLVRKYAPELKFLTSSGKTREGLCRRRNYNSHLEMVRHSPLANSMEEIKTILDKSRITPKHQNFFNIEHLEFDQDGAVLPFHLEFRFPDADLSATSVTAKTFLFLAMILKAVDLSQYGVIHVGMVHPWRRKLEIMDMLNNNEGNLATSDTSGITDDIIEELRQGMYELLELLAPILDNFEDNPSMDVLLALTEQPLSLMRCAGYSWNDIESRLFERTIIDEVGFDQTDQRLMQGIELGEWHAHPSMEAWHWNVAYALNLTPQELERRLEKIASFRGVRWNEQRGTFKFIK